MTVNLSKFPKPSNVKAQRSEIKLVFATRVLALSQCVTQDSLKCCLSGSLHIVWFIPIQPGAEIHCALMYRDSCLRRLQDYVSWSMIIDASWRVNLKPHLGKGIRAWVGCLWYQVPGAPIPVAYGIPVPWVKRQVNVMTYLCNCHAIPTHIIENGCNPCLP